MYPFFIETIGHPLGTPIDYLIVEFPNQNHIIYLYVTHDLQSRCVTHNKEKRDERIAEDEALE